MISPRNILRHELIGLDVLVVRASNPGHAGVSGRIIDETRNTLVIRTERGEKRIPKRFSLFRFRLPDGITVDVDGSSLEGQPERRITMRIR
ncbi:MAG: ribonuclease P protein component 1 [Methanomicrobiales archaeon]|nr:ribonuclease P protein component 1 [Methanomicrobiales archaeon]